MLAFFSVSRFMTRMILVNTVMGRPSGLARFLTSLALFLMAVVAIGRMAAGELVYEPGGIEVRTPAETTPKTPIPQALLDAARGPAR